MSYTDKCCGVCDEYQDYKENGKYIWLKYLKEFTIDGKRFYDNKTNVCMECIEKKSLHNVNVNDLKMSINYNEPKNITKGRTLFINPKNNKIWSCPNNRLSLEELNELGIKIKMSHKNPYGYNVTGEKITHEGLFTVGGVFSFDKRRLRKTLRKLGVKGKIEKLVK